VRVFPGGTSEEGREMILVVISDENTIQNLAKYKEINAKLADPRQISEEEAKRLISEAKPMYWATGAMHSGETGSPEMLMELAYRIAVDESDFIRTIRENAIIMITPVLEVDGRDKQVDVAMAKRKDPESNFPSRPLYWGKYIAHDNNRDNLALSLELSKHIMRTFLEYHPQVMHDLHESGPHLYISTGTGPYNAWLDPIVIDEWHQFAYQEVNDLTRQGVPGVWTHEFYDGWAPNYAFYAANGHNAIGRFYETQGAGDGSTRVINNRDDRAWYRPNPPLRRTLWSIRNNVNLQQSGLLVGMNHLASNRERFMENFYLKSKRSVTKASNEGPAAYIFPGDDPRPGQVARLLRLLQQQGIEVHKSEKAFTIKKTEYPKGSYIIRMDQPYSRMADMMLDRQYFNTGDPRPYDDVGWTLGPLYNIKTVRVEDIEVLSAPMNLIKDIAVQGGTENLERGSTKAFLINHNADNPLAAFVFKHSNLKMHAAAESFKVKEKSFNAGTFIIRTDENSGDLNSVLDEAGKKFGFTAYAVASLPKEATLEIDVPRVALVHTWQSTQDEGWVRIALDELEIPYDYISIHDIRNNPRLRDKYDVILFGPSRGDALSMVDGLRGDKPIPWKKTEITPNIGRQASTDDMRGGLELEGVLHLRDFIKDGGLFITLTGSSSLPIHFGLAQGISIKTTQDLWARGSVFKAEVVDKTSPIAYGYGNELGVYFNSSPVFSAGRAFDRRFFMMMGGVSRGRVSGRGGPEDPDIVQGRSRDMGQKTIEEFQKSRGAGEEPERRFGAQPSQSKTILRFAQKADELLISGGLANGEELAGAPAVVDCKLGEGHVVMFSINPMWRNETHGSFFLVFNAMMHHKNLDYKKPASKKSS
ncbi:MAG: M14 family zinc carboxypeptidase, partial [Candidatus Aminicenantes bacterium]|nr:M14 family zinc carboxypeptidase [Candidatus Aminicenantes bacterium]